MLSFGRRPQSSDRAVLDAIKRSLAVIQFTPDGTILDANENFCSALGYSLEEIRGRHHRLFVDSETARSPEYDAFWRKLGSGAFDSGEYKRIGKAGDEVWIQAAYSPVLSDSGQVEKVVKFASNITANKQAALDSRGKIEAISRSQAVIEFSTEGLVQDANANFLAVMGYKLEDILGSHHRLFMRPEAASSPEYGQFWKKLAAGEFVSGEFERIGKGGRTVWIQASYNPIKAPDGQVTKVVKYATDVTGRVNAVAELASGLGRMAAGDLTQPIEKPFTPELDRIRGDFNRSLAQLNQAMRHISSDARSLRDGMAEIQMAADDLSVRTEQQAVLGQRTAGALAEVTQSISDTARRSAKASGLAAETKASAEHSSQVVGRAVEAMRNIKHSSDSIAAIISVIDEIAFQTNLLALNASIEAARAGVAGRGFSVVAAEVRALAQRSAQAAKEIATLIGDAGGHVSEGVELVEETGAALGEIATQVIEVFANVEAISSSTTAQSKALGSVNQSVAFMDDATQQNAAMVEETTAATHSLSHRLSDLIALLDGFKVEAVPDSTGRPHDYSSAA